MTDVRSNLLRFVAVVLVVDALGLGLWRILPPGTSIRTVALFGTLVLAPLFGFLLVYVPAATGARESD
jgi:quinol-cytochrome oxidoreductase complex cytochrome b subunit